MGRMARKKHSFKGWRSRSRAALNRGLHRPNLRFDDGEKAKFLEIFAETGLQNKAARAVGVHPRTIRKHLDNDDEFAAAYEEAEGLYRDKIVEAVHEQAVTGVMEPVLGGKFRDQIVTHTRKFTPGILALEAKRVEPGYREKVQADIAVTGGVLLIPASPESADDWQKRFAASTEPVPLPEPVEVIPQTTPVDAEDDS